MDLSRLHIFNLISNRMSWLNARQQVLAQNVANADTPEYRAEDLAPLDFKSLMRGHDKRVTLAVTDPAHIAADGAANKTWRRETAKQDFEAVPSGNRVVLEEEMLKVAETAADYQLMTNLYSKHVGMLKTVLGRNR